MPSTRSNILLAACLVFAVALWGGNNAGTKHLVSTAGWPPIFTGSTRFVCAGLLLLGLLRCVPGLGGAHAVNDAMRRGLWWRGGLSLAAYIVVFNWALKFTSASHVALYLGAAPVWALLWEGRPANARTGTVRYAAAGLALAGVFVLLWPALRGTGVSLAGELLGLAASVLWTSYGRQCRWLTQGLGGLEVSAHTMWRAGVLLLPLAIGELIAQPFKPTPAQAGVQLYCIVAGGVVAFAIWAVALRQWPTSKVYLFNNLIPLSTMTWAHFCLDEPVTPTFWLAMLLIVAGVVLGQGKRFVLSSASSSTV